MSIGHADGPILQVGLSSPMRRLSYVLLDAASEYRDHRIMTNNDMNQVRADLVAFSPC